MTLAKIQTRRGSTAEWEAANPVLDSGEFGYDTTNGELRVGNGVATWTSLTPFYPGVPTGGGPGGTGNGGGPAIVIAAGNSPTRVKNKADYICTGTNDDVTINNAITAADNLIAGGTGGPRYGSVQLCDGTYQLSKPILIPGRGFTLAGMGFGTVIQPGSSFNGTTTGRSNANALIKMANTEAGNQAGCITIRDLFISGRCRLNYGTGAATGGVYKGIHLEITPGDAAAALSVLGTYGYPSGGPNESDNHSIFENLRIMDTAGGIYVRDTSGARGFQYKGCVVWFLTDGAVAIHSNASDSKVFQCVTASGGAANSTGIWMDGGNGLILQSKAFYFNQSGALGFNVGSSRATLVLCESQDNREGFRLGSVHAEMTGCRVDTQVASTYGVNASSANYFSFDGMLHTRSSGTLTNALCLPDRSEAGSGRVNAYIDPLTGGGITKPVTKGTGFTEVTANGELPTGIEASITIRGRGTLRRELAYTHP